MSTEDKNAPATTTANGTDGVAGITDALEASTLQELGRKVFVGNLSFATKEDQLRSVFAQHGEISEVQIIHRGLRSLGYGFVTFATSEDAEKAVSVANKSEIDGRVINAEIAKPAPGTPGGAIPRAAAKAAKASKATSAGNDEAKTSEDDKENQDHPSPTSSKSRRSKFRGRGRFRRFGQSRRPTGEAKPEANGEDRGAATDTSTPPEGDHADKPRSKRTRARRGKGAPRSPGGSTRRVPRRPKRTGPPEGEPSKTLLFVANLPFNVTEEQLKEFFASFPVTSANVIRRKFGPGAGKSKGFGFVEFENEETQLKALEETQGKELAGRPLYIKIAVNETKKDADEADDKADSTLAPVDVNNATA